MIVNRQTNLKMKTSSYLYASYFLGSNVLFGQRSIRIVILILNMYLKVFLNIKLPLVNLIPKSIPEIGYREKIKLHRGKEETTQ